MLSRALIRNVHPEETMENLSKQWFFCTTKTTYVQREKYQENLSNSASRASWAPSHHFLDIAVTCEPAQLHRSKRLSSDNEAQRDWKSWLESHTATGLFHRAWPFGLQEQEVPLHQLDHWNTPKLDVQARVHTLQGSTERSQPEKKAWLVTP